MIRWKKSTETLYGKNRIWREITSDKVVYFENSFMRIAYRYIPSKNGELGRFFAKFSGQAEYEVDYFTSNNLIEGILEDRIVSKSRYDSYDLIKN